jgi:hypothetical protein
MSVPEPPRSPGPPTEILGATGQPTRKWWQQGWGVAAIAAMGLLVGAGAGIGAAGGSTTKTVTSEGRTTTVEGAAPPARTVTVSHVVVHTHTVTQTQTAPPSESSSAESSSSGSAPGSYSGNGSKNLGAITVSQPSVIHWHATGGFFYVSGASTGSEPHYIALSSKASGGESVVAPGTYAEVTVAALGEWSFSISPQG